MIKITNLRKQYGNCKVINDISIDLKLGCTYAIVGSSGSGKSTFLKCIAGLEKPSGGEIDYKNVTTRDLGFIFQNFNLFTNMSVLENLTYAPQKVLGIEKEEALHNAVVYLEKVNLSPDIKNKYPIELSGGQKQRVAIARALCMNPKLILYDEPTSALDPENATEVLHVIKQLSKSKAITNIIVTHHLKFAWNIAERMIFLDGGKITESSDVDDFFLKPKNKNLQKFLHKADLINA